MKTLWIVGAGGFGREVLGFARQAIGAGGADYSIGGFIDDNAAGLEGFETGLGIAASIKDLTIGANDSFCIAVGSPEGRLALAEQLAAKGATFTSVVHPASVIAERSILGDGCIVGPGAFISVDARVGDHVAIGFNAAVGHDARVGDGSVITGCCIVNGSATLGRGVFLGSHSVVLPRVVLGDHVSSNAGSIIMRDAPASARIGGNPARQIPQLAV